MKTCGGVDVWMYRPTYTLGAEWSTSCPDSFTHSIEGWVGYSTCLEDVGWRKILPVPGLELDSSAVQPVASRYVVVSSHPGGWRGHSRQADDTIRHAKLTPWRPASDKCYNCCFVTFPARYTDCQNCVIWSEVASSNYIYTLMNLKEAIKSFHFSHEGA
jgi:hypothetical protein